MNFWKWRRRSLYTKRRKKKRKIKQQWWKNWEICMYMPIYTREKYAVCVCVFYTEPWQNSINYVGMRLRDAPCIRCDVYLRFFQCTHIHTRTHTHTYTASRNCCYTEHSLLSLMISHVLPEFCIHFYCICIHLSMWNLSCHHHHCVCIYKRMYTQRIWSHNISNFCILEMSQSQSRVC